MIQIEVSYADLDELVTKGYLDRACRNDPTSLQVALETFVSDALFG
jgi:hypothetical protein